MVLKGIERAKKAIRWLTANLDRHFVLKKVYKKHRKTQKCYKASFDQVDGLENANKKLKKAKIADETLVSKEIQGAEKGYKMIDS